MSEEVQFTPVETGDMSNIPPDAPVGEWTASFSVKKKATKPEKGAYPMLEITATLEQALTEGNEGSVGAKIREYLVFFPRTSPNFKMTGRRLKSMTERLGIPLPQTQTIQSWGDIEDFIRDIESTKGVVWTYHQVDKETREIRTQLAFDPPRNALPSAVSVDAPEDSDTGEESPGAKKKKSRRN